MVIDSSAVLAILQGEPEASALLDAWMADDLRLLAAPTRVEMSVVVRRRLGELGTRRLRRLLDSSAVTDVAFDRTLADLATDAYAEFGKGNHPAKLNLGDCFTYAVAKQTGEPILCVGDDFARTDVAVVPLDG